MRISLLGDLAISMVCHINSGRSPAKTTLVGVLKTMVVTLLTTSAMAFQETRVLPSLDNGATIGVVKLAMTSINHLDPLTNYTQWRQVMVSMYYPS